MNKKTKKIILGILIAVLILLLILLIYVIYLWKNVTSIFSKDDSIDENNENVYIRKNADLSDIAKYSTPTEDEVDTTLKSTYLNDVEKLLKNKNINEIFKLTNTKFLENHKLNSENFEKYLYDNKLIGDRISIKGVSTANQENDSCIYRIKYMVNYDIRYVNLIETSAYNYTLDFEQESIPTVIDHKYSISKDNITFDVEEVVRIESGISYKVTITNNNEYDVKFNFNSISDMAVVMSNGETVKQTDSALTVDRNKLSKGARLTRNFFFAINMQYQNDICGMIFYNVQIDNEKKDLVINFI